MELNPFLITGYRSPEYFCDREQETSRIIQAIRNQRNITLISSRRMGKTGLLLHSFKQLEQETKLVPVYFDILGTTSMSEFVEVFGNALVRTMNRSENGLRRFLKKLANMRPGLSVDPVSGEPRLSLDIRNEQESIHSLDILFSLMQEDSRDFLVAIDEFQQIESYHQKNVEALLRSQVQQAGRPIFIFSGSKKHMLSAMFSNPSRPFFSSTEMMYLDVIPTDSYYPFIIKHFELNNKSISRAALDRIVLHSSLHTFYVQFLCNRLYSQYKKVEQDDVDRMMMQIISENEPIYASYLNLLTDTQYRVLRALAREGVAEKPNSGAFLSKHGLGAASSVSQALESLAQKELIHAEDGKYELQDKFFAAWIRNKSF